MNNRDDLKKAAALFTALGAESRLTILKLLQGNRLCVGALSRLTGISAGAVSQHLRVLRSAGLVVAERRGYFVHYALAPAAGQRLQAVLNGIFKKRGEKVCAVKRSVRSRKT